MYVAETSLVPVGVAVARFIERQDWGGWWQLYPNWYGGVELRYIMGPLVPILIGWFNHLYGYDHFDISIRLILISYIIGSIGWGWLARNLGGSWKVAVVVAVVLTASPWKMISGLYLGETSVEVAKMWVPWIVVCVGKRKKWLGFWLLIGLLMTNTSALWLLITAIVALSIAQTSDIDTADEDRQQFAAFWQVFGYGMRLVLAGLVVATGWYGVDYWLRIAFSSWIGGVPAIETVIKMLISGRDWLPVTLIIVSSLGFKGKKSKLELFGWIWLVGFGGLSIYRCVANPGFWQDWTGWLAEVEVGAVILMSSLRKTGFAVWAMTLSLGLGIYLVMGRPKLLTADLPEGLIGVTQLAEMAKPEERVFLSGSGVWWAGAISELKQVRGGNDMAMPNRNWLDWIYTIRESEDVEQTRQALSRLEVRYVLVHGQDSKNYYHDFKHMQKWSELGEKVWEKNGDAIIKVY